MTDISCMGCMFQDIKIESTGFLSVLFYLTNVKFTVLPPALFNISNSYFLKLIQNVSIRPVFPGPVTYRRHWSMCLLLSMVRIMRLLERTCLLIQV